MKRLDINIPSRVLDRVNLIHSKGAKCYLVGGSILDCLSNKEVKDWDIEVHGISYQWLLDNLSGSSIGGNKFGVVRVEDIEFSLPRKENKSGLRHKDFDITLYESLPLEEAARRRDFTINSMYLDLQTMELHDPFGGQIDLKRNQLNIIDPKTFIEDPLRVFRAMQLVSRKVKYVTKETRDLCSSMIEDCRHLSGDSLFGEFSKMLLLGDRPDRGLKFLADTGIINLFPELADLIGCKQNKEHHPEGDVFNHTLLVLKEAASLRENIPDEWKLPFMFGMLLHDIGKPETTDKDTLTSYGHDKAGERTGKFFMKRLTKNEELIERTTSIISSHMRPLMLMKQSANMAAWRRLHNKCPLSILAYVSEADSNGRRREREDISDKILKIFQTVAKGETRNIRPILMGKHLIAIGLTPSREFSELLRKAYEYQLDTGEENISILLRHVLG